MKQKPYWNENGHAVFPNPKATGPEVAPDHPELTAEEIIALGRNPEDYGVDSPEPSLFDQHPLTPDEIEDDWGEEGEEQ